MARNYLIAVAIILVLVFGILFNNNTTTAAAIAQQQQLTGTIKGVGTSEIPLRVCGKFYTKDFLTVNFDASFFLSSDGKTGKVTSGTGILKTTDSGAFVYLSITGGDINIGVEPKLYTLKGTATFQSPSYCNPPSTVVFSIAKPDGAQLKCGNSDLITFNSISLTGSVSGNVSCTTIIDTTTTTPPTVTDTTPPTVTATLTPQAPDGQNGFYVQPVTVTWSGDDGPIGSGISSCDSPTSYSGPDGSSILLEGHCTDKAGNVGKGSIRIAYDANPPAINTPGPVIINEATSPQGAAVTYTVSATDTVDGSDPVTCTPASGSTFGFGTTTVTCKATDSAGNVAIKTFTVTVQQHITTNVPSPPSPSPQPQLPQQQQLPRLSPTQPTVPVQPDESGQIATAPPLSPQFPSSKQTVPVQPGESGQIATAPPLSPQFPSSKQTVPSQPSQPSQPTP